MSTFILIKNNLKIKFVQSYEILRFYKILFVYFLVLFVNFYNKKRFFLQSSKKKRSYI